MYGIISALKESNLFSSIDVIDLIDEKSVRLIRIKAKVLNRVNVDDVIEEIKGKIT